MTSNNQRISNLESQFHDQLQDSATLQQGFDAKLEQFMKKIELLINAKVPDFSTTSKFEPEYHQKVLICGYTQEDDCLCVVVESMESEFYEKDEHGDAIMDFEEEEVSSCDVDQTSDEDDDNAEPLVPEVGYSTVFQTGMGELNPPIHQVWDQSIHDKVIFVPKNEFSSFSLANNTVTGAFDTNKKALPVASKVFDGKPRIDTLTWSVFIAGCNQGEDCVCIITNQYQPKYNDSGGKTGIPMVTACGLTKKPNEQIADFTDVTNKLVVVEYAEDMYKFYKLAKKDSQIFDYIDSQLEVKKRMVQIFHLDNFVLVQSGKHVIGIELGTNSCVSTMDNNVEEIFHANKKGFGRKFIEKVDMLQYGCLIKGKKHPYYYVFSHLKVGLLSLGICTSKCVVGVLNLDDMKIQHRREGNEIMVDGRELLLYGFVVYVIISMLGRDGSVSTASSLLHNLQKDGLVGIDVYVYTSLIIACVSNGRYREAILVFNKMEEEGCNPSLITYIVILNVYGKMGMPWNRIAAMIDSMKHSGAASDAYTFNTLIISCCKQGSLHEEAKQIFEEMKLAGFIPDKVSFNTLLDVYGIKSVLVPGTHVQIDKLEHERGSEPKYVRRYRMTDPNSLEAATDAAGRIRILMEVKLSPGPSLCSIRRDGENRRWHDGVSVVSGNFLTAKRRGVVEGLDYGATGEVKKIDVSRIRERLDQDSIMILSNLGYSSSGEALNGNTCEVATVCALALGAEKLIYIMDGPFLDECGHLIRFLTLQDADTLIRRCAKQSEIAANYVKAVGQEDITSLSLGNFDILSPPNGKVFRDNYTATFHNGVGFDNGNGLWSSEQGFAIRGQERLSSLNGYLSELAAAVFVCRGGV